jgi:hypothetical protein
MPPEVASELIKDYSNNGSKLIDGIKNINV